MTATTNFAAPTGAVQLGHATYLAPDGSVAFFEFDLLKQEGDRVTLTPYPEGQAGVTFTATELGPDHVVFINPANPFPRSIEFRLDETGSLVTTITGEQQGHAVSQSFHQTRSTP